MNIESPNNNENLLAALHRADVEYILIGGVAAVIHGAARLTFDLDVVYKRSHENYQRMAAALHDCNPYLRGAPPGLPFQWSAETIERGLNFTLITDFGAIDLLGQIAGGAYDELFPYVVFKKAFGIEIPCLRLDKLIEVKRAAGRPKDFEAISELESLLEGLETRGKNSADN